MQIPVKLVSPVDHPSLGLLTDLTFRNILDGDRDYHNRPNIYEVRNEVLTACLLEANRQVVASKADKRKIFELMADPQHEYCWYRLLAASDPKKKVRITRTCPYPDCGALIRVEPNQLLLEEPVFEDDRRIETTHRLELQEPVVIREHVPGGVGKVWTIPWLEVGHCTGKDLEDCFQVLKASGEIEYGRVIRTRKLKTIPDGFPATTELIRRLGTSDIAEWEEWEAANRLVPFLQVATCPKCNRAVPYPRSDQGYF